MVHESAAVGFEQRADVYAQARPSYQPALVERFVEHFGTGTVVELGAGTGIFTRQLLAAGVAPIAIEPVVAMRAEFADALPGVDVRMGTAEDTRLGDISVDTVVVAQAFHWFDYEAALVEISRILRPGGHLVCVWNVKDVSVRWANAYTDLIDRYAGDTPRHRSMRWRHAIDSHAGFELVDDWSTPNPKPTNVEGVVARSLSTSFIAALDHTTQAELLADIRALVVPLGDQFDFPYRAELQAWRRR